MNQYWTICYVNHVYSPLDCGLLICKSCIKDWAKSKLIMDRLNEEVVIPCPNFKCKHSLTHNDLFKLLGKEQFEEVNLQYTSLYLSNTFDVRRCPNTACNYAGTIKMETCRSKLQCPQWEYTWREFVQMTKCQKVVKSLKDTVKFKTEAFSYLNEVFTGNPCPQCGLVIWKDGGCSHMIWQKCKYEFCWNCLGYYPNYVHEETTYCPLK